VILTARVINVEKCEDNHLLAFGK